MDHQLWLNEKDIPMRPKVKLVKNLQNYILLYDNYILTFISQLMSAIANNLFLLLGSA